MKIGSTIKKLFVLLSFLFMISALTPRSAMATGKTATPGNYQTAASTGIVGTVNKTRLLSLKTAPASIKPESLVISTAPQRTVYFAGQSFQPDDGISLEVIYTDGSSELLIYPECTIAPSGALSVSDKKVTFTYTDENGFSVSADQAITVKEPEKLKSIKASTTQDLTFDLCDGQIDIGYLTVTATYDGGTKAVVNSDDCEISPDRDFFKTDKEITITYEEDGVTATTTLPITVNSTGRKLQGIKITTPPSNTVYSVGQTFDPTGMEITAKFNDGYELLLDDPDKSRYTLTPSGPLNASDKAVTISFNCGDGTTATATQKITVNSSRAVLDGLEITSPPDKTIYGENEDFDYGGLTVAALYSNGTSKTLASKDYTVTPEKDLSLSDEYVTISYSEGDITVTAKQKITVKKSLVPVLEKIEITNAPYTDYIVGSSFDRGGLEVKAFYNDGTTKTITDDDYFFHISPDTDLQLSDTYVTVSYFENEVTASAQLPITVSEAVIPKKIVITNAPHTKYTAGNDFDRGGLKAKITFSDGSTKELSNDDYFFNISPEKNLRSSDKYVVISYFENEVTISVKLPVTVVSRGGRAYGGSASDDKDSSFKSNDSWSNTASGWKYLENGTPVAGTWRFLSYNGLNYWYYFDESGLMKTGWLDLNDRRFYLYPVSDGWMGRMLTGWQQIEGKWYYFETAAGKDQGRMYRSEKTPDGYYVGSDGTWDGRPAV